MERVPTDAVTVVLVRIVFVLATQVKFILCFSLIHKFGKYSPSPIGLHSLVGFSGPDCAVQNGAAPMVTGIKRLCSIEKKCQQVSLYSENGDFTDMDDTMCQVVSANVRSFMFCACKGCLHFPIQCPSPSQSPSKFIIVSMVDGQNGFHTHSVSQTARHH